MQKITTVNNAHTVNLTYCGYGKYIATWKGFPNSGPKNIRRTIHVVDNAKQLDNAAIQASDLFTDWLKETTPTGGLRDCIVTSITMGYVNPDKRVLLVQTDWTEINSSKIEAA